MSSGQRIRLGDGLARDVWLSNRCGSTALDLEQGAAVVPSGLCPDPCGHGRDVHRAAGIDAKDWLAKAKRLPGSRHDVGVSEPMRNLSKPDRGIRSIEVD